MYIPRDLDDVLEQWRLSPQRKPLMLRGVRQCGKTSAVWHLAANFENMVELNFERDSSLNALFEHNFDTTRIIRALELKYSQRIIPGRTLLFLDEIQLCPRAVTALRYFYEDCPALHVVAAGSLLELLLGSNTADGTLSFPVGRVRSIFVYPLSFLEFLRGCGHGTLADYLCAPSLTMIPGVHERLLALYRIFLLTGGMPQAVASYLESGSLLEGQRIHQDILRNFKDDFGKYSRAVPSEHLGRVFEYALHNVCCQTTASRAVAGLSGYYFETCVDLLSKAGLILPVRATSCESLPLDSGAKQSHKKLLAFDSGVYLSAAGLDTSALLTGDDLKTLNLGSVVELQTGLELTKYADPYFPSQLYYWYRSGANAEVDYVLQRGQDIIALEVKSGGRGSMKSLYSYLERHPKSPYGLRISTENFSSYDNIKVVPVYALCRVARGLSLTPQPA